MNEQHFGGLFNDVYHLFVNIPYVAPPMYEGQHQDMYQGIYDKMYAFDQKKEWKKWFRGKYIEYNQNMRKFEKNWKFFVKSKYDVGKFYDKISKLIPMEAEIVYTQENPPQRPLNRPYMYNRFGSRKLYRGPRGGRYYKKNGRKVYV